MPSTRAARVLGVATTVFALVLGAIAEKEGAGKRPTDSYVGVFHFSMNDDRLPLEEALKNETLRPLLDELWLDVYDYWNTYRYENTPTESEQSTELEKRANALLNNEVYENYSQVLLNASREYASEWTDEKWQETGYPHPDLVEGYLGAIYNMTTQTFYYIQGAYLGVGKSSGCAKQIDEVLSNKSEWEKMGSSAATTLMALLPTFLAFGNLYVPRSSEAYTTSAWVGITTAFYTLGLPVQSMSAVKPSNVHNLALFGIASLALIGRLGNIDKDGTAARKEDLEDLQEWTRDPQDDVVKAKFWGIKDLVGRWEKRWHCWHLPAFLVGAVQVVMFVIVIGPLFLSPGVPKFILGCTSDYFFEWTSLYLGVSAVVNSLFRYIMWEMSNHERIKVYSLSDSAKAHLSSIVAGTAVGETTATHIPPLLPPTIGRLRSFLFGSKTPSSTPTRGVPAKTQQQPGIFRRVFNKVRRRLSFIFNRAHFIDFIHAGFGNLASARRWRPVYILIHLSTEGRNPLMTLFTGFIEAALLLILTFFFAAQWGGNLVITMSALALLLVFITVGRALGFIYVWVSSQVWGLTVVNCDSVDEIRGVLRIIASMEGVLVKVNGATFFEGYRMDNREGFDGFIELYERGEFDEKPAPVPTNVPVPAKGSSSTVSTVGAQPNLKPASQPSPRPSLQSLSNQGANIV
ncbi:hypothetical protein FQN54_000790 [Arachnomyces sp. PD_36]|nr:hypothetical protein FQN54_000790 [Arachnomyces sp. PD_36]